MRRLEWKWMRRAGVNGTQSARMGPAETGGLLEMMGPRPSCVSGRKKDTVNSGDTHGSLTPAQDDFATFMLDTSRNTQGYDITSITTLAGGVRSKFVGRLV